jgi:hypothetical protein
MLKLPAALAKVRASGGAQPETSMSPERSTNTRFSS